MATPTYTLIDSVTLASSAASVTFSSIDQSYGDLVLVAKFTTASGNYSYLRINGDTGFNYPGVYMRGNGSAADSGTLNSTGIVDVPSGTSLGGLWTVQIFDYSATDKHKSALSRYDSAATSTNAVAHRWANTAAITSVTYVAGASNFLTGSTFHLYAIAKAL